ncbi:putative PEP-binding protein [Agromyces lapidis]|uniref:PEP-binding protein n=1 Tax=Agromyces lapidis TaxID=279574 RepID=A0ABV5SU06_9MICO
MAIRAAHAAGIKVGICGQAPSDYPDFAEFLVREGIDSISLNPDSFLRTAARVAEVERALQASPRSGSDDRFTGYPKARKVK